MIYDISAQRDSIKFGAGENHQDKDFRIVSSADTLQNKYDVLIFTDSKGTSLERTGKDWTDLLIRELNKKKLSYLFISRPKTLTIFFTLINFLKNNAFRFRYLITNMGFVDLTPKKQIFVDDILAQNSFPSNKYTINNFTPYTLSSGLTENLYSVNILSCAQQIAQFLSKSFKYSLLISTMSVHPQVPIKRNRPAEFFSQLKVSNQFIFSITTHTGNLHYLDVLNHQSEHHPLKTYDAVHFTQLGHDLMAQIITPYIWNYFHKL